MAIHDILVRVGADTSDYTRGLNGASQKLQAFSVLAVDSMNSLAAGTVNSADTVDTRLSRTQDRYIQFGASATALAAQVGIAFASITAATSAGIGVLVNHAAQFEYAFAGVRKTTEATEEQFKHLSREIRDMTLEIPVSATEIAKVAEVAGQLGVAVDDISEFTRVMSMMGVATNMSSDRAATSLARFMNIMGTSYSDVERLGSTIVDLGNNLATTESEIINMGLRLAGAGKQIGMTESDVLAFAGTLSSLGLRAEAAGSAFSRVMLEMNTAVLEGGDKLKEFARVSGMSAEEFRTAFQDDAASAIESFIYGLGDLGDEGENVVDVLKDLSLNELRTRDSLLRASEGTELLTKSLKLGSEAWEENIALSEEAQERYDTFLNRITVLGNKVSYVAQVFGTALMNALGGTIDRIESFLDIFVRLAQSFEESDGKIKEWVASLIIAIPIITGVAAAIAFFIAGVFALYTGLVMVAQVLGVTTAAIAAGAAKIFLLSTAAVALASAVTAGAIAIWSYWDEISAAASRMADSVAESFGRFIDVITDSELTVGEKVGIITEEFRKGMAEIASVVSDKTKEVWESFLNILPDSVVDFIQTSADKIADIFSDMFEYIGDIFRGDTDKLEEVFSRLIPAMIGVLVGGIPGLVIAASQYIPAVANQISEDSDQMVSSALEVISTFLTTFVEEASKFIEVGGEVVSNVIAGLAESMPDVVAVIVQLVELIIGTITELLPNILESAVEIITAIVSGISEGLPHIIDAILLLAVTIIDTLLTILPTVIQLGIDLVSTLVEGIVEALPMIVEAIIELIEVLLSTVIELLPDILEAGVEILLALVDGIVDALPTLVDAIVDLVIMIIEVITDNLPKIIDAGIEVILALIEGIIAAVPQLVGAILLLVGKLLWALLTSIPDVLVAGKDIVWALIEGIGSILVELLDTIFYLMGDLVTAIMEFMPVLIDAGAELIVSLIDGLMSMLGSLGTAAYDLGSAIADGISDFVSDLFSIGKDLVNGLKDGISNAKSAVVRTARGVASSVAGAFKSFFSIRSPSRLMRNDVGAMIVEGLMDGMTGELSAIKKVAQRISEAAKPDDIQMADFDVGKLKGKAEEATSRLHMEVTEGDYKHRSAENRVLTEIRDELRKQKETIIEMDRRVVGRLVEPDVTEAQERKRSTRDSFAEGGVF